MQLQLRQCLPIYPCERDVCFFSAVCSLLRMFPARACVLLQGTWYPNVIVPLNSDGSFDWGIPGSSTSGWEYMVVKNVARESNSLLGNTLPLMVLQEFGTPLDAEWSYTGLTNRNIAIGGVPAGARYLLADVFVSSTVADAHIPTFGRGNVYSDQLYVLTPADQPSTKLTAPTKNQVQVVHYGELDGPSSYYVRDTQAANTPAVALL